MSDLIPLTEVVINRESIPAVNARELHAFLEVETRFNDWIARRIKEYGFSQGIDFIATQERVGENQELTKKEYTIALDMAKELSMVERNKKGKQARQYFIACEKKLREVKPDRPQIAALEYVDRITSLLPNLCDTSKQQLLSEASEIDLGRRLIPLPVIEQKFYTATELAEEFGVSAQKVGRIATAFGLKNEECGEYRLSKSKYSNKQVEQFYYNEKGRQALAMLFAETTEIN
jgi:phage anti-repressor protein